MVATKRWNCIQIFIYQIMIYIEHNGITNQKSYKSRKEKTEKMYKELNHNLIITTENDLYDLDAKLKPILKIN